MEILKKLKLFGHKESEEVSPLIAETPPCPPPEQRTSDEMVEAMFSAAVGDTEVESGTDEAAGTRSLFSDENLYRVDAPASADTDTDADADTKPNTTNEEICYSEDEDFTAYSD